MFRVRELTTKLLLPDNWIALYKRLLYTAQTIIYIDDNSDIGYDVLKK